MKWPVSHLNSRFLGIRGERWRCPLFRENSPARHVIARTWKQRKNDLFIFSGAVFFLLHVGINKNLSQTREDISKKVKQQEGKGSEMIQKSRYFSNFAGFSGAWNRALSAENSPMWPNMSWDTKQKNFSVVEFRNRFSENMCNSPPPISHIFSREIALFFLLSPFLLREKEGRWKIGRSPTSLSSVYAVWQAGGEEEEVFFREKRRVMRLSPCLETSRKKWSQEVMGISRTNTHERGE